MQIISSILINFCSLIWVIRVFIGLRAKSGVFVWACIELNLLCFVYMLLIISQDCYRAVKYFLVQALGSRIFLISLFFLKGNHSGLVLRLILIALLLKLAIAPFQFWLVNILEDINWLRFFLIRTVQKLMPIYVFLLTLPQLRRRVVILGAGLAIWGGIITSEVKPILVYSSILGLSWIMARQSFFLCLLFLMAYIVRLYYLRRVFWALERQANSEVGIWDADALMRVGIFIRFVRMAGIPPFLGFFPKIIIIYSRWTWGGVSVLLALLLGRRGFIFIYLRICLVNLTWIRGVNLFSFWSPRKELAILILSSGGLSLLIFLCGSLVFETKKTVKMVHVSTELKVKPQELKLKPKRKT